MKGFVCLVGVTLSILTADAPRGELNGVWKRVDPLEHGASVEPLLREDLLHIENERFFYQGLGGSQRFEEPSGRLKIGEAGANGTIDFVYTNWGKHTLRGIYSIEGRTMKLRLAPRDKARPGAFDDRGVIEEWRRLWPRAGGTGEIGHVRVPRVVLDP